MKFGLAGCGQCCRACSARPLQGADPPQLPCPHIPFSPLPQQLSSGAEAGGSLRCPPGRRPPGTPLSVSAAPARGHGVALTCVPGAGVKLLGLAQPPLVPGVRKVDEQQQLDEEEEEGAHDPEVEPDWVGRRKGRRGSSRGAPACGRHLPGSLLTLTFIHSTVIHATPCIDVPSFREPQATHRDASWQGTGWVSRQVPLTPRGHVAKQQRPVSWMQTAAPTSVCSSW